MSMLGPVSVALATVPERPENAAVRALARYYAEQIDADPDQLESLGPKLLSALDALVLTPKAIAAVAKGGKRVPSASNPLDQVRGAHRNGLHVAPTVHPTVTGTDT
jgi:hypothetical protein